MAAIESVLDRLGNFLHSASDFDEIALLSSTGVYYAPRSMNATIISYVCIEISQSLLKRRHPAGLLSASSGHSERGIVRRIYRFCEGF